MKNQKILFYLLIALIAVFAISCTHQSQDWPGWRGENRDAKVVGFKAPAEWPTELTINWQTAVGLGDSPPSFVGGKLFLHVQQDSTEYALCVDALTGKEIWKTTLNPAFKMQGGGAQHPGPRSTPLVSGNKVFMLGGGGVFSCVESATGKVIWQNSDYTEVPVFYTSASPLVINDNCLIHLGGHDNGVIVAFNIEDGTKTWTIEGEPSTYASPVIMKLGSDEFVVLQSETNVLGISFAGKELFKIPTPGERRFYNSTTPVIVGDNIVIAGQGLGSKSYKIEKYGDKYSFSESWINPDFGGSFNTAVLNDGFLYGNEAAMGKAYCINASTGVTAWADTVKRDRFTLSLDLGKYMLSLPSNGELFFFKPNSEKFEEVVKYQLEDTPIYAHPLVVGDKIFIKGKEKLTCFSL